MLFLHIFITLANRSDFYYVKTPGVFTPGAVLSPTMASSFPWSPEHSYDLLLQCLYHSNLYPDLVPIPNCELLKGKIKGFLVFEYLPSLAKFLAGSNSGLAKIY